MDGVERSRLVAVVTAVVLTLFLVPTIVAGVGQLARERASPLPDYDLGPKIFEQKDPLMQALLVDAPHFASAEDVESAMATPDARVPGFRWDGELPPELLALELGGSVLYGVERMGSAVGVSGMITSGGRSAGADQLHPRSIHLCFRVVIRPGVGSTIEDAACDERLVAALGGGAEQRPLHDFDG